MLHEFAIESRYSQSRNRLVLRPRNSSPGCNAMVCPLEVAGDPLEDQGLILELQATLDGTFAVGQTITVIFVFTNWASEYPEITEVRGEYYPSVSSDIISTLTLGSTDSTTASYVITSGDVAAGFVTFTGNGSGTYGPGTITSNTDSVTIVAP